jgi:hypothetical protein
MVQVWNLICVGVDGVDFAIQRQRKSFVLCDVARCESKWQLAGQGTA